MIMEICEDPKISLDDHVLHRAIMRPVMTKTIQVRIEGGMYKDLLKMAKVERRTLSNYVRLLLEEALSKSKAA